MTLIEVLLAVSILVIMIWAFAPFIAKTFRQIAQAGELHIHLFNDVNDIDNELSDKNGLEIKYYPVDFLDTDPDEEGDILGVLAQSSNGYLNTFYTIPKSFINSDSFLYEGYGPNQPYDYFYAISFVPEDGNVQRNWKTEGLIIIGADGETTYTLTNIDNNELQNYFTDGNDFDPADFPFGSSVFCVPNILPDGLGPNTQPEQIFFLIKPDSLGLDNSNSPYTLYFTLKEEGGPDYLYPLVRIEVALPQFISVGEPVNNLDSERVASNANYWVDKFVEDTAEVKRLPDGIKFNDVIWFEDDNTARFYTVGDSGNLWYREDQEIWKKAGLIGSDNLNKIKRIVDSSDRNTGKFVVVGDGGKIYTSADGIVWNEIVTDFTDNLVAVAGYYDYCIAISHDGTILYSKDSDLSTWHRIGAPDTELQGINDLITDGLHFIAVGEDGMLAYLSKEDNPDNWTIIDQLTIDSGESGKYDLNSIIFTGYKGLIVGDSGQIHTFDGDIASTTLNTILEPGGDKLDLYDVVYARDYYVAVGEKGVIKNVPKDYVSISTEWNDSNKMIGFIDYDVDEEAPILYSIAGRN